MKRPDDVVILRLSGVDLRDDPIPEAWVLEGSPRARSTTWATSSDGTSTSFVWDCTAGRFRWHFPEDETVLVTDGGVTITAAGEAVHLGVGDAALFRAGTWAEWSVEDYVRKHAVHPLPAPRPAVWLSLAARRLRARRTPVG